MICPKCKSVYKTGSTCCSNCNVSLVNKVVMRDELEDDFETIKLVRLTSVANELEANMLLSYLKNYGIECYKKDKNIGSYMNIYMGYSIFGEDIYVAEDNYELAKDLIDEMSKSDRDQLNSFEDSQGVEENLIGEEEMNSIPFYKNKTIVARLILIGMIIGLLCSMILNKW